MIQVIEGLYIGTATDERVAEVDAVLNVAIDMPATRGWLNDVEYAQVGLVDGPGNELTDYCAATLFLKVLVRRYDKVLVCDHGGNRALVVAMMYINLTEGQRRPSPTEWSHWPTWEERVGVVGVGVHEAHKEAFDRMPWGVLCVL